MKLISYLSRQGPRLGAFKDDGFIDLQQAARDVGLDLPSDMRSFIGLAEAGLDIAEVALRSACPMPLSAGQLAPPIPELRKNVFAVGRNYQEHIEEGARARGVEPVVPEYVVFFSKAASAVVGHESDIKLNAAVTKKLDYEVELVGHWSPRPEHPLGPSV